MADSGYPDINPGGNTGVNTGAVQDTVNGTLNSAKATASQAADAIANTQAYQTVANGPVAKTASNEINATKSEFSNLAAARQTPDVKTATGQNLTHYHSMFYSLLSWENPRATAISYAVFATSIIVARYVPLDRYLLKALFTVLGVTAAAEIAGHVTLGEGFATKIRPRKYYTIPRETLESILGDVEQLINFFVIEFQRVLFAENLVATLTAFFAAVVSYFLVKVTPYWGLSLIALTATYFVPLIYISNRELIDEQINNASHIISAQANQVRDLAAEQTNKAFGATSSATQQYVSKAQGYLGAGKKTAVDKGLVSRETANSAPGLPVDKVGSTAPSSVNTANYSSTQSSVNTASYPSAQSNVNTASYPSAQSSANTASYPSVPASVDSSTFPTAPKTEPLASQPSTTTPAAFPTQ